MVKMPTETEPVTIIHGDCLDVLRTLPSGCVDAVVTDPPYGLNEKWAGGGGEKTLSSWRFHPSEAMGWDTATANDAVQSIVDLSIPSCIWGGNYYRLPQQRCWFVWDKKQPDTWTTGQAELAWTNLDRPVRTYRASQVEVHSEMGHKLHPTQKPVSLMRWCVRMMRLPESCVVLDPFAGSGTTGVAAILEGRRAILIEKEAKYVDIIRRRIAETLGKPVTLADGTRAGVNLFQSVA